MLKHKPLKFSQFLDESQEKDDASVYINANIKYNFRCHLKILCIKLFLFHLIFDMSPHTINVFIASNFKAAFIQNYPCEDITLK